MIARPRPVLPLSRAVVKNGSKMRSRLAAEMPGHVVLDVDIDHAALAALPPQAHPRLLSGVLAHVVEQAAELTERLQSPVLTDVSIDWNGLAVSDVVPAQIPDFTAARSRSRWSGRAVRLPRRCTA